MERRISVSANVRTRCERGHVDARTRSDQRGPSTGEWSITWPLRSIGVERDSNVAECGFVTVHLTTFGVEMGSQPGIHETKARSRQRYSFQAGSFHTRVRDYFFPTSSLAVATILSTVNPSSVKILAAGA